MSALVLSIVEIGGYPNFSSLYQQKGFAVEQVDSMRKATKLLKKIKPDVIVAEFNFQSDFRDRTSQLESLMASIAPYPDVKVIVFYDRDQAHQFARVTSRFELFSTLSYPIVEAELETQLRTIRASYN